VHNLPSPIEVSFSAGNRGNSVTNLRDAQETAVFSKTASYRRIFSLGNHGNREGRKLLLVTRVTGSLLGLVTEKMAVFRHFMCWLPGLPKLPAFLHDRRHSGEGRS
jgi:hypothetical protein